MANKTAKTSTVAFDSAMPEPDADERLALVEQALQRRHFLAIEFPGCEELAKRGWFDLQKQPLVKAKLAHLGAFIHSRWRLRIAGLCVFHAGVLVAPLIPCDGTSRTGDLAFGDDFQTQLAGEMQGAFNQLRRKLETIGANEQPTSTPEIDSQIPWPALEALSSAGRQGIHIGVLNTEGNFTAFQAPSLEEIRSHKPDFEGDRPVQVRGTVTGYDFARHALLIESRYLVHFDQSIDLEATFPRGKCVDFEVAPAPLRRMLAYTWIRGSTIETLI